MSPFADTISCGWDYMPNVKLRNVALRYGRALRLKYAIGLIAKT